MGILKARLSKLKMLGANLYFLGANGVFERRIAPGGGVAWYIWEGVCGGKFWHFNLKLVYLGCSSISILSGVVGANICSAGANICSDLLQAHFRSKCLGANSDFCGAQNLLQRYHWTTLLRVIWVGYNVLPERHLVAKRNGGFWVEGKIKGYVPR